MMSSSGLSRPSGLMTASVLGVFDGWIIIVEWMVRLPALPGLDEFSTIKLRCERLSLVPGVSPKFPESSS
ncbi:hypothetical protein SAMN05444007_108276 [Cribrihabitans marinus]|uniref:Uncharacterized protein n=1 Tax=Cribrihabitans marinus TaxID=1227549 RepID=A0A1H7CY97_9RHOB|nr:hypothetical protein SAMN05444007_108276 [Cribrihabitans marinus]